MILVVKKWARHNQINDASKGTLSSYTLVLMVLHYLQSQYNLKHKGNFSVLLECFGCCGSHLFFPSMQPVKSQSYRLYRWTTQ